MASVDGAIPVDVVADGEMGRRDTFTASLALDPYPDRGLTRWRFED